MINELLEKIFLISKDIKNLKKEDKDLDIQMAILQAEIGLLKLEIELKRKQTLSSIIK